MEIRTRMCTSLDGCVTTPDGWPAQLADPNLHPVGGPKTIDAFRSLGALDKLGLIVLPILLGEGCGSRRRSAPTPG
jgi:hypothetical protein